MACAVYAPIDEIKRGLQQLERAGLIEIYPSIHREGEAWDFVLAKTPNPRHARANPDAERPPQARALA